jgi:YgiT-type zinc finger domain-containing protein
MAIRCECGGEFVATRLATYDFTPIAGIPSELHNVRGLRCGQCGETALEGRIIHAALTALTLQVVRRPARLSQEYSRFLRHRLGLSQRELADRMGVHRVTVGDWETNATISPQHDHMLRSMALAHCARVARRIDPSVLIDALSNIHREPPPAPATPLVIDRQRRRTAAVAAVAG